jgi:uncharacterized protein (UPF0264 family)
MDQVAMRLLVSVASGAEASAALAGGADFIDAKDPLTGALGAVSEEVLREVHAAVGGARPVTAALGDAADEAQIEDAARVFAAAGAAFVKVGFAGIASVPRAVALTMAAVRGAAAGGRGTSGVVAFTGVVAVAYADAERVASLAAGSLVEVAARAGASGVLLDTADKAGPGLRRLIAPAALARWVAEAHEGGLFVALAGQLTMDDFAFVRDAGADIAGVRGAACEGGRIGRVATERVRLLRARCGPASAATLAHAAFG